MATIGTFTKGETGFTDAVKTLTLNVKAKFIPAEKESDKAPDFRILAGAVEFGAAWKKTAQNGREYLSVHLDDHAWRRQCQTRPFQAMTSSVLMQAASSKDTDSGFFSMKICK